MDEDEVADAISDIESQLADIQQAIAQYNTGYAIRDAFDAVRGGLRRHRADITSLTDRVSALEGNGG
jgi:BMFP domain-containing protein YqiC